jgi:aspartyl-tRNA(Asn)/glutamyl-tRNA(Gln) amidotransferase subunit B
MEYKAVIGLEIHVELKTKSKMFCQCSADYFGKKPNSQTCPVCLGLPGALPVPNEKAIEWTIKIGKALGCRINKISKFDRKHYFYPDLPKGYQISQYDEPIAILGSLKIKNEEKEFKITRVHLEEDTGKLIHGEDNTLIDFNRSSVPLVEIVTEPDFDNVDDVKRFLEELQVIIRYLGVSDADMEKGTMRMEPNISLRKLPSKQLPNYKVEVKNINSFRFVKQAIEYELKRQQEILERGETPQQETRGFDEKKQVTYSQRSKEQAHDYRYFPEPDIPPMSFTQEYIDSIKLPELPQQKIEKYLKDFHIKLEDAFILTRSFKMAGYFEEVISRLKNKKVKNKNLAQQLANYIINKKISTSLTIDEFIKKAIEMMSPRLVDTKQLDESIKRVIAANAKVVEDYKRGKENAIMFLVGQVMREMKGQAEANVVISKIKEQISRNK